MDLSNSYKPQFDDKTDTMDFYLAEIPESGGHWIYKEDMSPSVACDHQWETEPPFTQWEKCFKCEDSKKKDEIVPFGL